jgi:hypothetical protein
MAAKPSRRARVDEAKPLAEERKDLIERYTVDDAEAERLARRRLGEPEAPPVESAAAARRRSGKPNAPVAEAATAVRRRSGKPKAPVAEAATAARPRPGEPEAPAAEVEQSVQKAKTDAATESYTPAPMTAEPRSNRSAAADVTGFGADSDDAPGSPDEHAAPAGETDEKRLADEQARLAAEAEATRLTDEQTRQAAEAEVRRLTEELTRLVAEAEAMRTGRQSPRLDTAAEERRTVEPQLKAVAAPFDVSPVEQTEVCYVARWRGYVTCEFLARQPDGAIVATSGTFRWRKSDPPPEDGPAREAFDRLVAELLAYGWEERGRGAVWYERRFERPAHSTPAEREASAVTRTRH